jgi:hypothetical protein
MASDIRFELDKAGGAEVLRKNTVLQSLQLNAMEDILINIKAQFFQTFGLQGNFKLVEFTTDRSSVKISAADARTATVLKKHPRWLDTFTNNITI